MKELMKILSLIFLFVCLTGVSVYAQDDEEDNPLTEDEYDVYKEKFRVKEKMFIGGGVGFGFTDRQLNFALSPFVGLRLTDHLHVATGFNYNHLALKDGLGYKGNFNFLDARLFARYLLINFETIGRGIKREPGDPLGGLYAHVEYSRNVVYTRKENSPRYDFVTPDHFYVGGGYQQNFYRGFGYFAEIVYDVLKENQDYGGWPIDIRFGLYYGF